MIWGKKIDYAPWNREIYVITGLSLKNLSKNEIGVHWGYGDFSPSNP